jgi:mortality factor 4-like protein 1
MVKQKFAVGDIVCAADSGQIYPAKVLKAQSDAEEKVWKYFIHFQKWDSKYDTWIDEHRLCGMKDEAGKKKLLEKIMLMAPDAGGPKETKKRGKGASRASDSATMEPGSEFNDSNSAEGPKSKKKLLGLSSEELAASRKRHKALLQADVLDERDSDFPTKLQIPVSLKKHLVDEWGLITKDPKRLLKLPRQMPVAKLLKDFLEHRAKKLEPDEVR